MHWLIPQMAATAGAELFQSQELGAYSGSPTQEQGPENLVHPPLLSVELNRKWNRQGLNRCPYKMPVSQSGA